MANSKTGGQQLLDIRCRFHSLTAILIAGVVIGVVYFSGENKSFFSVLLNQQSFVSIGSSSRVVNGLSSHKCDLFSGKWIYDNVSYPLYKEQSCTYMSDQLACQKFGRKDLDYQHWRWQPHHCDLPRFNATMLLERLRNKRLVYVGDSLNRGQWISMLCLVDSAIPSPSQKYMHYKYNSSLSIFKAREYNASIEFYWEPLLVESNSDDPTHHRLLERIVRPNSIAKHARRWSDADFLVFNTYLWWTHPSIKLLWGSFEESDGIYKVIEMQRSYEMALKTWSDWLEIHINRSKTQLFFMTMSPVHERGELWGKEEGENCYGEKELIEEENMGRQVNITDTKMMETVKSTIDELKGRGIQVQLINITKLTQYRKDGHPSIYRKQWEALTQDQIANPTTYADCIHWCLPGVSDVWNELLFAHIFDH